MAASTYLPNTASLDEGFPAALPVPELLREFATWLADKPRSSLGWFHLESEPLPATYVGDDDVTTALRAKLGTFMVFPEGSRLALWKRDDGPSAVVRLGSDRTVREVAPDFESFLIALAGGQTGLRELERAGADARAALTAWLTEHAVQPTGAVLEPGAFERWFEATRTRAAAVPNRAATPARSSPLVAAMPDDLFDRADLLLGCASDDPRVVRFFEVLGIDLPALRDPELLRAITLPAAGVEFEIAWPWDRGSEWLAAEYPKARRRELEARRARMFWSISLYVVAELRTADGRDGQRVQHDFRPFAGRLPFGMVAQDDATTLEEKLGPPVKGSYGSRTWDYPARRRTLIGGFNEGPFARDDMPRGGLKSLTWRFGQSV